MNGLVQNAFSPRECMSFLYCWSEKILGFSVAEKMIIVTKAE